jgi:hypothetical protein
MFDNVRKWGASLESVSEMRGEEVDNRGVDLL